LLSERHQGLHGSQRDIFGEIAAYCQNVPPHLPRHPGRPDLRPGPARAFRTGRLRLNGPGSSSDQGHRYAGRLLEIEGHWSDVSSGHGWVPLTLLDCGVLRKRYQRGYGSSRGNSSFIEDAGGACKYRPPPDKIHMNPNCFGKWFGGKYELGRRMRWFLTSTGKEKISRSR
jgi:hypothetical protein